jgi:hypothetical protein
MTTVTTKMIQSHLGMSKVITALVLLTTLAACQDEESCYNKIDSRLSDSAIIDGEGLFLVSIYHNEDTSACDFTVVGGRLYKK